MGPAWSPSHGDTETVRNIWVRYPSQPQRVGLHCFNTVKAWQDIYGHRNGRQDLSNHPIHVGSVDPMPGVQTISMADHDNHARQRKALSHGFSKKALWEQEEIIPGFVNNLMNNSYGFAASGETFDIVKWL